MWNNAEISRSLATANQNVQQNVATAMERTHPSISAVHSMQSLK